MVQETQATIMVISAMAKGIVGMGKLSVDSIKMMNKVKNHLELKNAMNKVGNIELKAFEKFRGKSNQLVGVLNEEMKNKLIENANAYRLLYVLLPGRKEGEYTVILDGADVNKINHLFKKEFNDIFKVSNLSTELNILENDYYLKNFNIDASKAINEPITDSQLYVLDKKPDTIKDDVGKEYTLVKDRELKYAPSNYLEATEAIAYLYGRIDNEPMYYVEKQAEELGKEMKNTEEQTLENNEDKAAEQLSGNIENKAAEQLSGNIENKAAEQLSGNIENKAAEQLSENIENKAEKQLSGNIEDKAAEQLSGNIENKAAEQLSGNIENKAAEQLSGNIENKAEKQLSGNIENKAAEQLSGNRENKDEEILNDGYFDYILNNISNEELEKQAEDSVYDVSKKKDEVKEKIDIKDINIKNDVEKTM